MAARSRRAWSTLRDEVRTLLRESSASYWTDAELLIYANTALDMRAAQLAEAQEGWITQPFSADIVANQREYSLPEGTGRIRRVALAYSDGTEIELARNDRIGEDYHPEPGAAVGRYGARPTYRVVDNLLYIEPPDTEARTDGLRLEIECLPARLTGDVSKLALAFPDLMEALLIFDVWALATGVEDAQGESKEGAGSRLMAMYRKLELAWENWVQVRSHGRVFGQAFYLGD